MYNFELQDFKYIHGNQLSHLKNGSFMSNIKVKYRAQKRH